MISYTTKCNICTTIITLTSLLINPNLLCDSIRLEYRPVLGQLYTYSDVKVTEVSDPDINNDYSIEREETVCTERIVDIDQLENDVITVETTCTSVELTPPNERKKKNLLALRRRIKINRHGMMQNALASAVVGDLNNVFPLHNVDVGDSWTTTADGLGKANNRYTLASVDETQVATIDMQSTISIFEGFGTGTVYATLKIDSKTGVTIGKEETSIVQILSQRKVMTKSKRLIAQE